MVKYFYTLNKMVKFVKIDKHKCEWDVELSFIILPGEDHL